jgi:hypothetical protein
MLAREEVRIFEGLVSRFDSLSEARVKCGGATGLEPASSCVNGVGSAAPKSDVLPLGSPSFSIFLLKEKDLAEELVVARCTKMWLRMHGVPRLFPIPIKRKRGM